MMNKEKPGSCSNTMTGPDTRTAKKNALTGSDYTSIKEYSRQLEQDLFVSQTERDALFREFLFLLRDQPIAWRVWHLENFHCYRLPESVMRQLREELRIPSRVSA